MARMARGEDSGAANVISMARARSAQQARRATFRWPHDGPHPERVAAALEATAAEAALVAMNGTVIAVNRHWVVAAPACVPGAGFVGAWRLAELDARDAAQLITGVRGALTGVEGYDHEFELGGRRATLTVTPLSGGVVTVAHRSVRAAGAPAGIDPLTGLADRNRFVERLTQMLGAGDGRQVACWS